MYLLQPSKRHTESEKELNPWRQQRERNTEDGGREEGRAIGRERHRKSKRGREKRERERERERDTHRETADIDPNVPYPPQACPAPQLRSMSFLIAKGYSWICLPG